MVAPRGQGRGEGLARERGGGFGMAARRLLLLTDDPALAALLPAQLAQGTEFRAEPEAPPAGEARLSAAQGRLEATLLDAAAAPGAAHWAPRLRAAGGGRPVLVLGAEAPPEGAAEALPKPLRLPDLVARLRGVLAAFEASPEATIPLGGLAFHPVGRFLAAPGGARIRLTEKEAAILLHLHRAEGRSVPRAELLGEVWGYARSVSTHTLETHIYRLRRKIEAAPGGAALLVTEEGGYRLGAAPASDQTPPDQANWAGRGT
jgi:DNA-binding response OmpR family regulator